MSTQSRIQQQPSRIMRFPVVFQRLMMLVAMAAMVLACIPVSSAFTMRMEYTPPVKASVGKLNNRRLSRDSTTKPGDSDSASRSSSSKSAYAAGAAFYQPPPSPASPSADSFEIRMRAMVLGNQKKRVITRKAARPTRKLPPNVCVVESLKDYKRVVADETDRVVAVRFYAPWCKACKAVAPLYYHLATKYPDVVFVDVPVTNQNSNLHQGLGVPSLPFGHIYHPTAGLVEELQLTRKHLGGFEQSLDSYYTGSCDIPDDADEVSS